MYRLKYVHALLYEKRKLNTVICVCLHVIFCFSQLFISYPHIPLVNIFIKQSFTKAQSPPKVIYTHTEHITHLYNGGISPYNPININRFNRCYSL